MAHSRGTLVNRSADGNHKWIAQVRRLLMAGYGVEDIAIRLDCSVEDVRLEVKILREYGSLSRMFTRKQEQRLPKGLTTVVLTGGI